MNTQEKERLGNWYGIPAEVILWYNSGICYSRLMVSTKAAALKAARKVKGRTVNGGWFHGMPLGVINRVAATTSHPACWEVIV